MKKMNIRQSILIAAAAAAAVFFSSCMRMQLNTELRENGTASIGVTYALSTDYYTEDDLKDSGHEIEHYTFDGKEYIGYSYSQDVKSYKEFETTLVNLDELDDVSDTKEPFFSECHATMKNRFFFKDVDFSAKTNVIQRTSADNAARVEEILKFDFTLKMPGKILEVEGGNISTDGKTIIFPVDPQISNEYHATSRTIAWTNIIIMIVIVAIALISVVVYFSYKESHKKKLFLENMPGTVGAPSPDAPAASDISENKTDI